MDRRVNLLIDNPNSARSGYINIDPFADGKNDLIIKGDISNLDEHVDDAELSELIALDILHYFNGSDVDTILNQWIKKLAHKGQITISVTDVYEVSHAFFHKAKDWNIDKFNEIMYGPQKSESKWDFKRSGFTLNQLVEVLKNKGLKILNKRIVNYMALVTAERQ